MSETTTINLPFVLRRNIRFVNKVIDFFLLEEIDNIKFNEAKSICIQGLLPMNSNASVFIEQGYFSIEDFRTYFWKSEGEIEEINFKVIEFTLDLLLDKLIITRLESFFNRSMTPRYKAGGAYAKMLYANGLIHNLLFGFNYIFESYQSSVFKIENIDHQGESSIGTGFLVRGDDNHDLIVTNKHVLDKCVELRVFDKDDHPISFRPPVKENENDLAIIPIPIQANTPRFCLNVRVDVLSDIITIGYPAVPMTKSAYQICHKGEINSFVDDYFGNKFFLFSAKTSSGNSGSPVIDPAGMVVGIVTQELFDKNKFTERGMPPYYAAIPAVNIRLMVRNWKLKNDPTGESQSGDSQTSSE